MFRVKNVDGITKYSQFRFRAVSGPHVVRARPGAIFVTSATPVFAESLGDFDGNPQCILTISFSSLSRNCVFCRSENTFFDRFWTPPREGVFSPRSHFRYSKSASRPSFKDKRGRWIFGVSEKRKARKGITFGMLSGSDRNTTNRK